MSGSKKRSTIWIAPFSNASTTKSRLCTSNRWVVASQQLRCTCSSTSLSECSSAFAPPSPPLPAAFTSDAPFAAAAAPTLSAPERVCGAAVSRLFCIHRGSGLLGAPSACCVRHALPLVPALAMVMAGPILLLLFLGVHMRGVARCVITAETAATAAGPAALAAANPFAAADLVRSRSDLDGDLVGSGSACDG